LIVLSQSEILQAPDHFHGSSLGVSVKDRIDVLHDIGADVQELSFVLYGGERLFGLVVLHNLNGFGGGSEQFDVSLHTHVTKHEQCWTGRCLPKYQLAVTKDAIPILAATRLPSRSGERSKNGQPHVVPLSRQAADLLRSRTTKTPNPAALIFATKTGNALSNRDRETKAVQAASGTAGWHQHDLRRTGAMMFGEMDEFRSVLASLLSQARLAGNASVDVRAGDLYRPVGVYPLPGHRMPTSRAAMRCDAQCAWVTKSSPSGPRARQ
jgi:hypothetical protein